MACGSMNGGLGSEQAQGTQDPFSFGQDMWGAQLSALTLVWTTPWRAAHVVMSEALRENFGKES